MPCQFAWDGDPSTVWHPSGSGQGAYTSLHLHQAAILHSISIQQYSWSSGFASNLGLLLNSTEWFELHATSADSGTEWKAGDTPQVTSLVTLLIKKVGPYPGSAFGGISDISLRGCFISEAVMETEIVESEPELEEEVSTNVRTEDDIFHFDTAAMQSGSMKDIESPTSDIPGSSLGMLSLPVVGTALAVLTIVFCLSMIAYGFQARRRYQWHISEEARVSFSPSRQEGSQEDMYDLVTKEEYDLVTKEDYDLVPLEDDNLSLKI